MHKELSAKEKAVVKILFIWFIFHCVACRFIPAREIFTNKVISSNNGLVENVGKLTREQIFNSMIEKFNLQNTAKFEICINNQNTISGVEKRISGNIGDEILGNLYGRWTFMLDGNDIYRIHPEQFGAISMNVYKANGDYLVKDFYVPRNTLGCQPVDRNETYRAVFNFNVLRPIGGPRNLQEDLINKDRTYISACLTPKSSFITLIVIAVFYGIAKLLDS